MNVVVNSIQSAWAPFAETTGYYWTKYDEYKVSGIFFCIYLGVNDSIMH
jgi:hypothetical protein